MTRTSFRNGLRSAFLSALAFGALALAATPASFAQEAEPPAGPDEMQKKVVEIERLMKQAESLLARSLDRRRARDEAKASEEEIEKLLDQKARESAGKSADELRKLAQEGSTEAVETLKKLTGEATREATELARKRIEELMESGGEGAGGAGDGIRKLLEEGRQDGERSKQLLEWILEQAKQGQGQGSGSPKKPQQKKPEEKKPEEKKPEEKERGPQKPPDPTGDAQDPPKEDWFARLPDQVRKAYLAQDWDSIPPRWRSLLRAWTRKMAEELEQDQ